jgi:hypothetical protein
MEALADEFGLALGHGSVDTPTLVSEVRPMLRTAYLTRSGVADRHFS